MASNQERYPVKFREVLSCAFGVIGIVSYYASVYPYFIAEYPKIRIFCIFLAWCLVGFSLIDWLQRGRSFWFAFLMGLLLAIVPTALSYWFFEPRYSPLRPGKPRIEIGRKGERCPRDQECSVKRVKGALESGTVPLGEYMVILFAIPEDGITHILLRDVDGAVTAQPRGDQYEFRGVRIPAFDNKNLRIVAASIFAKDVDALTKKGTGNSNDGFLYEGRPDLLDPAGRTRLLFSEESSISMADQEEKSDKCVPQLKAEREQFAAERERLEAELKRLAVATARWAAERERKKRRRGGGGLVKSDAPVKPAETIQEPPTDPKLSYAKALHQEYKRLSAEIDRLRAVDPREWPDSSTTSALYVRSMDIVLELGGETPENRKLACSLLQDLHFYLTRPSENRSLRMRNKLLFKEKDGRITYQRLNKLCPERSLSEFTITLGSP